jgi:hypothetical protein
MSSEPDAGGPGSEPKPKGQEQPAPETPPAASRASGPASRLDPSVLERLQERISTWKVVRGQGAGAERSGRFDKFTERAKRVLSYAEQEAESFNHNYIGTEHLLLGLVREGEGIAAHALNNLGVKLDEVRAAVEFIIGRGDRAVSGPRSLTPRSKKVIELAVEEARRLKHRYIGTEHLLLGLIREGEGIAAGVLESLGVDMARARAQVIQHGGRPGAQAGTAAGELPGELPDVTGAKDSVITCRIASGDLEAIDALIEAGIRSTRSDAAAWLIHAGIQANLDLFDTVYSTVAEIRRLREQAQSAAKDLESRDQPQPDQPA